MQVTALTRAGWECRILKEGISISRDSKPLGTYLFTAGRVCPKCSQVLKIGEEDCFLCAGSSYFERIRVIGQYFHDRKDLLSQHIIELKSGIEKAVPLGLALALCVTKRFPELQKCDVIIPVPNHQEEIKQRGFDKMLELATVVSEEVNIPLDHGILIKTQPAAMRGKSVVGRLQTAESLYATRQGCTYHHVLLIDDVVTSGATVSKCSEELRRAGAERVDVLAAARTARKDM
jgi:ComF family protein